MRLLLGIFAGAVATLLWTIKPRWGADELEEEFGRKQISIRQAPALGDSGGQFHATMPHCSEAVFSRGIPPGRQGAGSVGWGAPAGGRGVGGWGQLDLTGTMAPLQAARVRPLHREAAARQG